MDCSLSFSSWEKKSNQKRDVVSSKNGNTAGDNKERNLVP